MSMDDQYREMGYFMRSLSEFNEQLRVSMDDLRQKHDYVSPHWQDEFRRHYDAQWEPLHQTMERYVAHEGRGYVEFLNIKLYQLGRYLNG